MNIDLDEVDATDSLSPIESIQIALSSERWAGRI